MGSSDGSRLSERRRRSISRRALALLRLEKEEERRLMGLFIPAETRGLNTTCAKSRSSEMSEITRPRPAAQ